MVIFNQALKRIFSNKTKLLVLLIMPILFILMFALQEERSLTVGIVDNDKSILSAKLIEEITSMNKVKVEIVNEEAIYDKTVSYQLDYSLIIERGFEEQLILGESPDVKEFYLNEREKLFFARNLVDNFLYQMAVIASGVDNDSERFHLALVAYENGDLALADSNNSQETKLSQARAAMGFLVQFMLYMSVITASLVSEDKNSGVFYRVFYAPVTLKRYISENLSAFLLVGVIQVSLIMVLLKTVFGMDFGTHPINLYLLFVLFSFVCISLGMWIVSLFKKPIGAYATIILITTPLVMLGGSYWPMDFMPEVLQNIALFLPTTWVMSGVDQILYEGSSIIGIYLNVAVLIIFAGIFLSAGLVKKVDISK